MKSWIFPAMIGATSNETLWSFPISLLHHVQATPPVLILLFNRPAVTRRLLAAIQTGRPRELFVAADGPRSDHPEDIERCRQTRELVDDVDWPCQIHRLYRNTNLGLQKAVTTALDWFFEHVEAGIVLEDDCLPAPDFFTFTGEMLERYANVSQVMHVSGLNMKPEQHFSPYSYFFTGVGHVWGWATWRRAWRLNDPTMADWPEIRHEFGFAAPPLRRALGYKFDSAFAGRKLTWSRVWYYTTVRHGGLAIIPAVNLIRNVGFGADATHTRDERHPLRLEEWGRLTQPLVYPTYLAVNPLYERHLTRYHKGSYRRQVGELGRALLNVLGAPGFVATKGVDQR